MATEDGIQISNALIAKLPDNEKRGDLRKILWKKSSGDCFLCGGPLNRSSDRIVVDHDEPEEEGGETKLANLNLAHARCNAWKRNHPTAPAKAFLGFRRFLEEAKGVSVYGDCLSYFRITPKESQLEFESDHLLRIELPDDTIQRVPVISESNSSGTFLYCFVEVPISAIFHDADCQPRTIKPKQVWSIFSDLQRNPLHEPPSCRTHKKQGKVRLLMFDGQHKTLASLLMGRQSVAVKIYLELQAKATRHLVNSIQAKIPKLPLSAMEIMSKMGMEYADQLAEYIEKVREGEASEDGFLRWLPADTRKRGRQAFENACINAIWETEGLDLRDFVGDGRPIKEAAAKSKLLKPLVFTRPLQQAFEVSDVIRERESELVTKLLDDLVGAGFRATTDPPRDDEEEKIRRRMYQSSLVYIAGLVRKVASHVLKIEEGECLGLKKPSRQQLKEISEAIKRIVAHPVWAHPYNTKRMQEVRDSLSKNQNADSAFKAVGLNIGYALAGELEPNWAG